LLPFRRESGVYKSFNMTNKACDKDIAAREYGDSNESKGAKLSVKKVC
jgi:hypothetical protein